MNRRDFIAGLIGSGAALALFGCGRGRSVGDRVTITYSTHWTGVDTHAPVMEWVYRKFRSERPDVDLNVFEIAGGKLMYMSKALAEAAAGGGPDILQYLTYDHVRSGFVMDLTDLTAQWRDRFYPAALDSCSWNGRLYSLPIEYCPTPCIWNKSVLAKVDRDVPTTYEEYIDLGIALKKKGLHLTSWAAGGQNMFLPLLYSHPDAEKAIESQEWESQPFLRVIEYMKQVTDNKLLPPNEIELQFDSAVSLFQNARMGHYINGAWTLRNDITAQGIDPELRNQVDFAPFPAVDGVRPIRMFAAAALALSKRLEKDEKKLDASLAFLDLITGEEATRRFVSEAMSPSGVKSDITEELAGPLLYRFLKAEDQATMSFAPTNEPGWWHDKAWFRAIPNMWCSLIEGAAAKKALSVFAQGMRT